MKKLIIITCLLLPLCGMAQTTEIGVAGGAKMKSGYTGSLGIYQRIWKLQVGAVCEVSTLNNFSNYLFLLPNDDNYRMIAPGFNVNYIIPIPGGYVYPGVATRYTIGENGDGYRLKGTEIGVHAGVSIRLVKSLYANAELGLRMHSALFDADKLDFSEHGSSPKETEIVPYRVTYPNVPATIGLRWVF